MFSVQIWVHGKNGTASIKLIKIFAFDQCNVWCFYLWCISALILNDNWMKLCVGFMCDIIVNKCEKLNEPLASVLSLFIQFSSKCIPFNARNKNQKSNYRHARHHIQDTIINQYVDRIVFHIKYMWHESRAHHPPEWIHRIYRIITIDASCQFKFELTLSNSFSAPKSDPKRWKIINSLVVL